MKTKYKAGDILFYDYYKIDGEKNLCNWYIVFLNEYDEIEIRDLGNNNLPCIDESDFEHRGTFLDHLDKLTPEDIEYHNLTGLLITDYLRLKKEVQGE